jgi:hypothetical protein
MDICLNFMGEDFIADVDYDIKSYGSPAHMGSLSYAGDPGDPPEFEVNSITLRRDLPGRQNEAMRFAYPRAPEFEATGALFDCLCENEKIFAAICTAIEEDGGGDFYDDY